LSLDDNQQQLDERGLAGSIVADEGEDGTARNNEIERCERFGPAETFA